MVVLDNLGGAAARSVGIDSLPHQNAAIAKVTFRAYRDDGMLPRVKRVPRAHPW